MQGSLPIKKIYVDSRFKTAGSQSNTNFSVELSESLDLPDRCACYLDDIVVPVSYYNCDVNNNKLYVRKLTGSTESPTIDDKIVSLSVGQFNAEQIASEIQTQLRSTFPSGNGMQFICTYNNTKGTITINPNDPAVRFQLFTDVEIKSKVSNTWSGAFYDATNPCSFNDTLRNTEGASSTYSTTNVYNSGFIDITAGKHYLYLTSNLGSYHALGPRGERTICKKIAVTSNYGFNIIEAASFSGDDYIDVSRQSIKTLQFRLTDAYGNIINLNGSTISFSVVFTVLKDDV